MIKIEFEQLVHKKHGAKYNKSRLARNIGMPKTTFIRYLKGDITRVDLPLISKICTYFECSVADILKFTPDA